MRFSHVLLVVVLCVAATFATVTYMGKHSLIVAQNSKPEESAYERVMRTGVLRCGYFLYPDIFELDIKTGKHSGMYYELVEEIAKRLGLKTEWTEEVGFTTAFDGLKTKRYDAVCVPIAPTPNRARVAEFSDPMMFASSYAYVRADDTRFDNDYGKINDPSVRIVFLEGEMAHVIQMEDFPLSKAVSLPNLSDMSQVMMHVITGKADIAFTEPSTAQVFLDNSPGKLKRVFGPPLRMSSAGLVVGVGESELKSLLNTAISSLQNSGFLKKVVDNYTRIPDQIFLPAQPWGESSVPLKNKTTP